ncbi:MAG: tetraacyldisaccharide 4'-kinase [Gammaproteobacteria bacterium]|nr:MAG: tetraacyldisaccharide 4'-kinase [Gammaproteobacteria bacterium]
MSLEQYWYRRGPVTLALWPASQLYRALSALRAPLWQGINCLRRRPPVPVIVVGNITVGGTGKTPMVLWLIEHLRQRGRTPGVVSRGYGGEARYPLEVRRDTPPEQAGDEPVLIAARSGAPVVVDPRRRRALRRLLEAHPEVDVVISDDGLQHHALPRDLEIVLVDGRRGFGNRMLLPAGPLREPVSRLQEADFVVINGLARESVDGYRMGLEAGMLQDLHDPEQQMPLDGMRHQKVHAVAGIGHPDRFFDTLRAHGITVIEHPFPDHHPFAPEDLCFNDDLPIIMTEKDAVKCRAFAPSHCWYLPVSAVLDRAFVQQLDQRLDALNA